MTLTAAGDLSVFDEARRTSVAAVVAAEVDKPLSAVSVTVVAASVRIDVRIAAGTNATSAAEMAGTLATSFESAAAATALLASAQVNVTLPPSVSTDQEVVVFALPSAPPASGYVQVLHSVFEWRRINACHTSVTVIVMELANATGVLADRILNTTVHRIASQQATGHACDHVRLYTLFTGGSDPTLDELKSMLVNNGLLGGSLHVVANRTTLETISIEELERLQREHAEERQKWEEAERNRQKERRHLLRWLGAVAGCLASVALVGIWGCRWLRRHFVRVRKQRKGHRVFLSYRVASDKALVRKLYYKLRAKHVDAWWDVACLEPGKRWEDGFADGLFGAVVFVPVLSKAALAPFSKLRADSANDNVFLEYRGALEMESRGTIKCVYPCPHVVACPWSDASALVAVAGSSIRCLQAPLRRRHISASNGWQRCAGRGTQTFSASAACLPAAWTTSR